LAHDVLDDSKLCSGVREVCERLCERGRERKRERARARENGGRDGGRGGWERDRQRGGGGGLDCSRNVTCPGL
jgi:hypothetical protein